MTLQSDITIRASKFRQEAVSDSERKLNQKLVDITAKSPKWYKVGAARYRQMGEAGETPFPKPVLLPGARTLNIPSREAGRDLPCRLILPEHGGQVKGVFMHIHGGGWTLMSEKHQDAFLKEIADSSNLTVVSVYYRLAPEHPFPQGPEDCFDVAEWLVDHSQDQFGAPLLFAGGESAGGHLAVLSAFHLLKTRPNFAFSGLVLSFAVFDLSLGPFIRNIKRPLAILDSTSVAHFVDSFLPNTTNEQRKDPAISPYYADLYNMKLPPALFLCGTEDCLLEDSVLMSARWQMAGGEAVLRLFSGAPHGFIIFDQNKAESARDGMRSIREFLKERLGAS